MSVSSFPPFLDELLIDYLFKVQTFFKNKYSKIELEITKLRNDLVSLKEKINNYKPNKGRRRMSIQDQERYKNELDVRI